MKHPTTDICDHGLELPVMNGGTEPRRRAHTSPSPSRSSTSGPGLTIPASPPCFPSTPVASWKSSQHTDQGSSRPGFPMAMKCACLTVTPVRSAPESQCAAPGLQATYLLSTVWTYAGQNMNLYWFSSRGAEDMAGQSPTNTRTLKSGDRSPWSGGRGRRHRAYGRDNVRPLC